MFPLFATNFIFPAVEQRGHDRRVFTSVKLVSFNLKMAFEWCAFTMFSFKVLKSDHLWDFLQPDMKQLDVPLFSWWMLIILKKKQNI